MFDTTKICHWKINILGSWKKQRIYYCHLVLYGSFVESCLWWTPLSFFSICDSFSRRVFNLSINIAGPPGLAHPPLGSYCSWMRKLREYWLSQWMKCFFPENGMLYENSHSTEHTQTIRKLSLLFPTSENHVTSFTYFALWAHLFLGLTYPGGKLFFLFILSLF